jgi:hypothetical protein
VRYELPSPRDQHVVHYDALIERLKKLQFQFVPPLEELPETDREDLTKNVITGILPSASLQPLLRTPEIAGVLLMPVDYKLPANADAPVHVRLELTSGLGPARQRTLAEQTLLLLGVLGFREAVGYDQHGLTGQPFTRLVGMIPASEVNSLLKDIRRQPSGWLAPRFTPADLPLPIQKVSPILVTEVLPGREPLKEPAPIPARGNPNLEKIGDALWALVSQKEKETTLARVEIILAYDPGENESWRPALLKAAPSLIVEGRLGPILTGQIRLGQVPALTALPVVSVVRLPRPAEVAVAPTVQFKTDNAAALRLSGVEALHQLGYRGKLRGVPVRVAIVDSDFRGYEALVKSRRLPPGTRLVDLSAEGNPLLLPEPVAEKGPGPGHGTQCALAATLAAPEIGLTLIRVDAAAPYQLQTAARYLRGVTVGSENLRRRLDELVRDRATLRKRVAELQDERRAILNNFEDETAYQRDYEILGTARAWVFSEREWHALRVADWERDSEELRQREQRYLKLVSDLEGLKGIPIVACPLLWNEGYPLGGASALSQALADTAGGGVLWFQAAGNTRGQSWAGPADDRDDTGVINFAPPQTLLPQGRWTTALSFLGWQPFETGVQPALPDGARVRLSLQWRESHDPSLFFRPDQPDLYRRPLATLHLLVLRQRDPDGKVLPADDFEVVARSSGLPARLDNHPAGSIYEQTLEFTAVKGARYALRLERERATRWVLAKDPASGRPVLEQLRNLAPTGIRALGTPTLPALEPTWDLQPRLFVEVEGLRGQGRPVFVDFPTDRGSIGLPADAHELIIVGAADLAGQPQPSSVRGSPLNLDLHIKPDTLAFDRLDVSPGGGARAYGTSLSASFAAGMAAAMLSAGAPCEQVRQIFQRRIEIQLPR